MKNLARYDDRDDIRTNLIESFDRLMAFVEKHLDDKFYIENNQRIYEPYPKNLKIAKVFKEIGLADELGPGVRNIYKYTKIYSGGLPELKEDDIFKAYIPLVSNEEEQKEKNDKKQNVGVNVGVNKTQNKILKLIEENHNITQREIASKLKTTMRTIERNINILKERGIIERVGSDKTGYWKVKNK